MVVWRVACVCVGGCLSHNDSWKNRQKKYKEKKQTEEAHENDTGLSDGLMGKTDGGAQEEK